MNQIIETGVDKLVNLIKEKKRISIPEAAKELRVSPTVIEEWADFLEEEDIVHIEYKLTTPYIVDKKVNKKDVEKKAKEFGSKKEIFVRKAEVALDFIESQAGNLKKIKAEFDKVKKDIGMDISNVKDELKELEKLEKLKKNIDTDALAQKNETHKKFSELNNMLTREQRKYTALLNEINEEEKKIEKEKQEAKGMEELESQLDKKVIGIKFTIKQIEKVAQSKKSEVQDSEKHVEKLKKMIDDVKGNLSEEKKKIDEIIKESKDKEDKIIKLQEDIIGKIKKKESEFKGKNVASKKIEQFFNEKLKTEELVDKLHSERQELEKELINLIRKAKSFQLISRSNEFNKNVKELEDRFKNVEKKKEVFEQELKKLYQTFNKK